MIFLQRQLRFIIKLKRCILESLHEFFSMIVKFKSDIVFNSRKGAKDKASASGNAHSTIDNSVRFDGIVRDVDFHDSTYLPRTSSVLITGTVADFNIEEEFILHDQSDIEFHGQERACIVAEQLTIAKTQPPSQIFLQTDHPRKGGVQCTMG